jgi:hypothetical protein
MECVRRAGTKLLEIIQESLHLYHKSIVPHTVIIVGTVGSFRYFDLLWTEK